MTSLSPNAQRRRALLALVFLSALFTPAPLRAQKGGAAPGVGIRASKNIVIACPGDDASARVRLRAVVDDASCATRYTWGATGGRVVGEGPEVVWDFSDTPPNGRYYDVTLTVESKPGCGPRRAVSAPARIILWGCAPRINVVEVYGCPASCPTGTADTREPEPILDVSVTPTPQPEPTRQGPEKRLLSLNASVRNARDGRPVPGARVSFFLDGRPVGEGEADAGGRFLREGLTPGIYQFVASADSFDELKSTVTLDQYSSGSVVISLLPTHAPPGTSPTPSPSPDASPTPLVILSHTPEPRPTSEVRPTPDPTVETKGWVWLPWALAAAGLAAAAGIAYMMLKGGGAAASSTVGAAESSLAAAGATKQSDKVYCTVFAPRSAPPGRKFIAQVFAHLKEQEDQLAALAAKGVGSAAERFVTSKRMGREIERDTEIFFRLEMEGLVVSEPEQSIFWDGVIDSVTFNVKVPDDFTPRAVISNVIFGTVNEEGLRAVIGHVNFTFEVAAEAAPATLPAAAQAAGVATTAAAATERLPQTQVDHDCAFISYASEEREEVLKIVRGIMADGTRCLMDKLTFKTGEEWEAAIGRAIAESDVFYLFWSTEASKSEWVRKEIDLALEKQRESKVRPLILPMPLEDTSRVAPPEKLRHLHFDDPVLDRTELEKYRRSLRPQSPPQN